MAYTIIDGCPSTSGDDFQLNTTTLLKHAARVYPEVEVVSRRSDGTLFRYNYKGVHERCQQMANALVRLGVKPGDRIGVMGWNTHRYFELYFAISGIGAAVLQMNLRLPPHDLSYVVNHSEAKFIFVDESLVPLVEAVAGDLKTVEGFVVMTDEKLDENRVQLRPVMSYETLMAAEEPVFDWPMINERSTYSASYSSGTTGKPKGVYYSHRCIYLHTTAVVIDQRVCHNDVIIQIVPMFHCQGWGLWLCGPMTGAKMVFPGPYSVDTAGALVDLIVSEKVTFGGGSPAIFMPMLEYIRTLPEKPDLSGLRMVSGASEPPLSMMQGYWDLGHAQIVHGYGATETTPIILINTPKPAIDHWPQEDKWNNQRKQGLPLPGSECKIVDAEGHAVPSDGETMGEILFRGPWVTREYYDDPRTIDCFTEDGFWKSGDVGTVDAHGYVKVTDRIKDVIKSGGEWISSIDLENAIMGNENVLEACVVGLSHPKWDERPVAFVVLNPYRADKSVTKEDILKRLEGRFAKWQLPDEVIFVDELPKTSVGKLDKKVLRAENEHFFR
ncbi:long-chain-fatty-acid--CoA ligase [Desulfosarcina sp. OttesenSCG-928-A07]|nr:long-chain-fatty-acid--CoA ligase [Desulfosarcina sp. OttesenSCG-928-G17]MDL2328205.1 long-chain-fatty-acid--CoA ligase [Desulfosarcina sp. OttesenSCG-928-A07]